MEVVLVVVAAVLATLAGLYVYYHNREVRLRKLAEAHRDVCRLTITKVWNVLREKTAITVNAYSQFVSLFPTLMERRYAAGADQLQRFVVEHNPGLDMTLYRDLNLTVESLRSEFLNAQALYRDVVREHSTLIETVPASWFIGRRTPLTPEIAVSAEADRRYGAGQDEPIGLLQ